MKKWIVPSHVSIGWRDGKWEQGYCHAQVADGQINHKKLSRLQGGLLPVSNKEKGSIPQHRQHTWETERQTSAHSEENAGALQGKEGVTAHLR